MNRGQLYVLNYSVPTVNEPFVNEVYVERGEVVLHLRSENFYYVLLTQYGVRYVAIGLVNHGRTAEALVIEEQVVRYE